MVSTDCIAIIAYFLDPTEPYFISPLEVLNIQFTINLKIDTMFT